MEQRQLIPKPDGGGLPTPLDRRAFERLWVALLQSWWSSVVMVPARPGLSGLLVAQGLAAAGAEYRGEPVEVLNAVGAQLGQCRGLLDQVAAVKSDHALLLAIDCPLEQESALLLARAAQAAVLLVPVGSTRLDEGRRVVELVGRGRFLGAVTLPDGA